ncbi:MAG: hypothetical protein EXR51_04675 [Dehalococcoidia bacterium]|nr:hypothetical protein [Dehalococcoidia bacterium]
MFHTSRTVWKSATARFLRLPLFSSAMALAVALSACQAAAPPAAQAPAAAGQTAPQAGPPIKIGVIMSTTGGLAPFGNDALPAIELFVEETNAKGGINGRKIELVVVNDESKPELALSGAKKLVQQDKVLVIVGPVSQVVTAAVAPTIEESKIPNVSCNCITGPLTPYQFSTFPSKAMMKVQADFIKSHGDNQVGVMAQAGALAETLKRFNFPDLEAEGIRIAAFEQFQPTDTDLTPVLARLRSQGIKHVYVGASGTQAALAAKNFKQLNYPGYYWTFAGNANQAYVDLLGDAMDVVNMAGTKMLVYKKLPDSDPAKKRLTEFATKYNAKTKRDPGTYAAFFYDSMTSMADAIAKGGDSQEKIRDALENQKGLQLLNGMLNRSKDEHNGLDPDWHNIGIDPATKEFVVKK